MNQEWICINDTTSNICTIISKLWVVLEAIQGTIIMQVEALVAALMQVVIKVAGTTVAGTTVAVALMVVEVGIIIRRNA